VGAHRKHIRQKLDLHSDRELLAYARQWGLDSTSFRGAG
jgi:DNA-binding CsgD family transcriptional regulator